MNNYVVVFANCWMALKAATKQELIEKFCGQRDFVEVMTEDDFCDKCIKDLNDYEY